MTSDLKKLLVGFAFIAVIGGAASIVESFDRGAAGDYQPYRMTRAERIQRDVDGCVGVVRMNLDNRAIGLSAPAEGILPFEETAYNAALADYPYGGAPDDVVLEGYCRDARTR